MKCLAGGGVGPGSGLTMEWFLSLAPSLRPRSPLSRSLAGFRLPGRAGRYAWGVGRKLSVAGPKAPSQPWKEGAGTSAPLPLLALLFLWVSGSLEVRTDCQTSVLHPLSYKHYTNSPRLLIGCYEFNCACTRIYVFM